jgi:hypothetical protein
MEETVEVGPSRGAFSDTLWPTVVSKAEGVELRTHYI